MQIINQKALYTFSNFRFTILNLQFTKLIVTFAIELQIQILSNLHYGSCFTTQTVS